MSEGFLQKSLEELHVGDGAKLEVVNDLVAVDFLSELVLEVGVE